MKTIFKITMFFGILWLINTNNYGFAQTLSPMELSDNNFCSIEATIFNSDSVCRIEWSDPMLWYYDDGSWEDFISWVTAGGECVVKFELPATQLQLTGAEINVGDGSFPVGNNFLGNYFLLVVYTNDGEGGLPGTLLDAVTVTVDNYGWVSYKGLNISIDDTVFYLGIRQVLPPVAAPPVGVDTDFPTENYSYVKKPSDNEWILAPNQNFMIRAFTCVDSKQLHHQPKNDYVGIIISRVSDFDPTIGETPADGILTLLDSINGFSHSYYDSSFISLPTGYYAYALKKFNPIDSTFGNWNYSNIVQHTVGIIENKLSKTMFSISPNPAKSILTIDIIDKNNVGKTTIEIIDINGKTVLTAKPLFSSAQLDIKSIKPGLYIVKANNNKTLATKKLIIQ